VENPGSLLLPNVVNDPFGCFFPMIVNLNMIWHIGDVHLRNSIVILENIGNFRMSLFELGEGRFEFFSIERNPNALHFLGQNVLFGVLLIVFRLERFNFKNLNSS
jgi:hypothetical protein